MKRKPFSEEQIIAVLREHEAGMATSATAGARDTLCANMGCVERAECATRS